MYEEWELKILAFVTWKGTFATLTYPTHGSLFSKRSDCGGHSQHRWTLYDVDNPERELLQLVVQHLSCKVTPFERHKCRACSYPAQKKMCQAPDDLFYLINIASEDTCNRALKKIGATQFVLEPGYADRYMQRVPAPANEAKFVKTTQKVRQRFDTLEADILAAVVKKNRMERRIMSSPIQTKSDPSVSTPLTAPADTSDVTDDDFRMMFD